MGALCGYGACPGGGGYGWLKEGPEDWLGGYAAGGMGCCHCRRSGGPRP